MDLHIFEKLNLTTCKKVHPLENHLNHKIDISGSLLAEKTYSCTM